MEDPLAPTGAMGDARLSDAAAVSVTALSVVVLLETLRALYPPAYAAIGIRFELIPIFLGIFLAPALAPLSRLLGPRGAYVSAVAALVGSRALLQLAAPPSLWLVAISTTATLAAFAVVATVLQGGRNGGAAIAVGTVAGFGIDAAVKGAFATWDRVWQGGTLGLLVTGVILGLLVLAAVVSLRDGAELRGEPTTGRFIRFAGYAVLFMPWMMLLSSPAYAAASTAASLQMAVVLTTAGSALAVLAAIATLRSNWPRAIGFAAAAGLGAVLYALTAVQGAVALGLMAAGQVLGAALWAAILGPEPALPRSPRLWRSGLGLAAGFTVMALLTLAHPLHYEHPLPISNRWLPVAAVALAAMVVVTAPIRRPTDRGTTPFSAMGAVSPGGAALALAAICVSAIGATATIVLTASSPVAAKAAAYPVTVASLNTALGIDQRGAVRFDLLAGDIASLDADVVALQEVTRGWALSGMSDFASWHQHHTGLPWFFVPAADRQFGNMLLTRVAAAGFEPLPLPRGGGSVDRSAAVATFTTPSGPLVVMGVHLQHRNTPGSVRARAEEAGVLLDRWAGGPHTVILGDFNPRNEPDPEDVDAPRLLELPGVFGNDLQPFLDAGFVTTQPTRRCTVPTSNQNCSDFVFVTSDLTQEPPVEVRAGDVADHKMLRSRLVPR